MASVHGSFVPQAGTSVVAVGQETDISFMAAKVAAIMVLAVAVAVVTKPLESCVWEMCACRNTRTVDPELHSVVAYKGERAEGQGTRKLMFLVPPTRQRGVSNILHVYRPSTFSPVVPQSSGTSPALARRCFLVCISLQHKPRGSAKPKQGQLQENTRSDNSATPSVHIDVEHDGVNCIASIRV